MPHLTYNDVIYHSEISAVQCRKLQVLQNSCVRFVCNLRKYDHISSSIKKLKIPQLHEVRKFHMLCLLFKCLHDEGMPEYLVSRFATLSSTHGRNTRSANNLILSIPEFRTLAYSNSFTVSVIRYWNELPAEIRLAASFKVFKERYTRKKLFE
jgi:hypothetical protein